MRTTTTIERLVKKNRRIRLIARLQKFRALGLTGCASAALFFGKIFAADMPLPAPASFNGDAGTEGNMLYLTLKFDDGQKIKCLMDTGSPFTVFDTAVRTKLGSFRGKTHIVTIENDSQKANIYGAPKVYLGGLQLKTGPVVYVTEMNAGSGILGMDCLQNYCIQLDFDSDAISFLNPDHLDTNNLGEAFPLKPDRALNEYHYPINRFQTKTGFLNFYNENWLLDTGTSMDCSLQPKLFEQLLKSRDGLIVHKPINGYSGEEALFATTVFGTNIYTNIYVARSPHNGLANPNIIGLRFLSRNLVTLNFPKNMMYLKQISGTPRLSRYDNYLLKNNPEGLRAKFALLTMKTTGKLPGFFPEDVLLFDSHPESTTTPAKIAETFTLQKIGDMDLFHYTLAKTLLEPQWKIEKAWRTDPNGTVTREYNLNNTNTGPEWPTP